MFNMWKYACAILLLEKYLVTLQYLPVILFCWEAEIDTVKEEK